MVVTFQRKTLVDDGWGGQKEEWANHITDEGYLDQLSTDEILASEKLGTISSHVYITFNIIDVKDTDRAIIDGEIYEITGKPDNPMNMDRQLEIPLRSTGERYEVQE